MINTWDDTNRETYHKDFEANKAHGDLSWRCPLTSLTNRHYNDPEVMYGIVTPDRPWLLSPPDILVAGATEQDADEVKVMPLSWIDLLPYQTDRPSQYARICCNSKGSA